MEVQKYLPADKAKRKNYLNQVKTYNCIYAGDEVNNHKYMELNKCAGTRYKDYRPRKWINFNENNGDLKIGSWPVGPENAPLVLTFLETNSICVRFVHLNLKGMVMVDDDADIERGGSRTL